MCKRKTAQLRVVGDVSTYGVLIEVVRIEQRESERVGLAQMYRKVKELKSEAMRQVQENLWY